MVKYYLIIPLKRGTPLVRTIFLQIYERETAEYLFSWKILVRFKNENYLHKYELKMSNQSVHEIIFSFSSKNLFFFAYFKISLWRYSVCILYINFLFMLKVFNRWPCLMVTILFFFYI